MSLKITNPLVSVDWLKDNLKEKNLIILDCTIPKVVGQLSALEDKKQIKGAVFFDIKKMFSKKDAVFPNTVLSPKEFEEESQKLGIKEDSIIVCYDDLGIYSSPRVWWMFQLMGFKNVAVLDGGLPEWKKHNCPIERPQNHQLNKGNFKADYQPHKLKFTNDVLEAINNDNILIVDARSKGRFYATEPEPRNDVKTGHIPDSVSLPYKEVQEKGKMKTVEELKSIFKNFKNKEGVIFSCGSGITASILALGAHLAGLENYSVYDGSWTEWGLTDNLPIDI